MRAFLGTVLSLIAAGVLLIAYGLLAPRAAAVASAAPTTYGSGQLERPMYQPERPIYASERMSLSGGRAASSYGAPWSIDRPARRATFDQGSSASRPWPVPGYENAGRPAATHAAVDRGRDWKRTAMVIGGSTAVAAGVGAIFGGKKGSLIGAALGGGASTIYELRRR
jgi:hypothetical protein